MLKPFDAILLNKAIKGGGGVQPSGSINISANGTFDVSAFADAIVNVPGADEIMQRIISGSTIQLYDANVLSISERACASNLCIGAIDLPNCTNIGSSAFSYCSRLSMVNLPKIEYINNNAFAYCSSLASFSASTLITIRNSVFQDCKGMSIFDCPNVEAMGNFCFANCSKLQSIYLPKVSGILFATFSYCSEMSTAYLGKVSTFMASVFYGCRKLVSLYLPGSFCALSSSNAFYSTPIAGYTASTGGIYGSVFVPASLVDTYKTADIWSLFADRITAIV